MIPEILFALVSDGRQGVAMDFFMSCFQWRRKRDMEIVKSFDGYTRRARNAVATYFLTETQIPWLLFVDMDIGFTDQDIEYLFESDEPIVGGVYYLKGTKQVCSVRLMDAKFPEDKVRERVEVRRLGTGFMRIHRSVFEEISDPAFAEPYKTHEGKLQWDFFPQPVTDGELLTEDWGFCDLARRAGFRIMLDTRIQLLHK